MKSPPTRILHWFQLVRVFGVHTIFSGYMALTPEKLNDMGYAAVRKRCFWLIFVLMHALVVCRSMD